MITLLHRVDVTTLTIAEQNAINDFVNVATELDTHKDVQITTVYEVPSCGVFLADGTDVPCLAVAYDPGLDSYAILTLGGKVREYLHGEIF